MTLSIPSNIRKPALILGAFACACLLSVSVVYWLVRPTILAQQQTALLANFRAISQTDVTPALLDTAKPVTLNEQTATYYRSSNGEQFIKATTGRGYSGDITALIGIAADNRTLLGVRVLNHKETPGLGDKIEERISPWILGFRGKKWGETRFKVKKDGGDFDAFTGATITPRAVTELVGSVLQAWAAQAEEVHGND